MVLVTRNEVFAAVDHFSDASHMTGVGPLHSRSAIHTLNLRRYRAVAKSNLLFEDSPQIKADHAADVLVGRDDCGTSLHHQRGAARKSTWAYFGRLFLL
jgi:hypothetical protein